MKLNKTKIEVKREFFYRYLIPFAEDLMSQGKTEPIIKEFYEEIVKNRLKYKQNKQGD